MVQRPASSFLLRRVAICLTLLALLAAAPSWAQLTVEPGMLSNRRLGQLNDASAVGWNPALLAMRWTEFDLLSAGSYDSALTLSRTLYALFAKLGPVALGTNGPLDDSLGRVNPRQYHAGFGLPIADGIGAGASVRWLDGRGFAGSAEYLLAGLYHPRPDLLAGITLGNVTAANDHGLWLDVQGAYAPFDWATIVGGLRLDARDTAGGNSSVSPSLGVSIGIGDNSLIVSGSYHFNQSLARIGLEAVLGGITFGSINGLDGAGALSGGVALARWSSMSEQSVGDELPVDTEPPPTLGWAPERAYVPTGLEYTKPTSNNDAVRNQESIEMPCTGASATTFDSPTGLASLIAAGGPSYADLAARIRQIAPIPSRLFREVRRHYYAPPVRNRELASGDTLSLYSLDGYGLSVQSVDATRFPLVSLIMRVTDETGRTVPGLGLGDFGFRDTSTHVVAVRPADSTFSVPVDIVVMVDCSGSMSDEIEQVRQNIERFADNLEARGIDYRIGGVLYGSIIYDTLHPTRDIGRYKQFLARAQAIGRDEITTLALKAATEMDFRPAAQRVFLLVTDDWAVQNNARLDESQLTQMLWDTRARLYSIITPCRNNAAVVTRLTLGREFDIRAPFTSILDEIGSDLTTTYELVYESRVAREVVVPKVTILRGRVRDEKGAPVPTSIALESPGRDAMRIVTNQTTAEYETEIAEGVAYTARLGGGIYFPLEEAIDLRAASKGDTIVRDFRLRTRNTTVSGRVTDENGRPVDAEVRIEDAGTLERIDTVVATNGLYEATLEEGRVYRLTPTAKNFIPFPEEVDARVERGTELKRDLRVMSIDAAIASGAVFRLKNIFFDFDRWDLKSESSRELDRLVALLEEYPVIRVEVGAHTDSKGSESYNVTLSARRAQSVTDYLVAQGIDESRLSSKGYGESVPVASNDTDEGRAMNRRVEFKLVR